MNTPELITDRSQGATFYCADCRKTYQTCKCKVYMSVDAIRPQPDRRFKHGHCKRKGISPTYKSWRNMITRCTDFKRASFKRYGGRGISVCERWLAYGNFLKDMGERPFGWSIDRIDNDGNYEPSNCRWADAETQGRSRGL